MTSWKDKLKGNPFPWLLERDSVQPAVRYFALRDILDRPEDDIEVKQARAAIMTSGPVPAILAAQQPEGYWAKPGPGYSPKYRSTVWQVTFLAQLGADGTDPRVRAAGEYVLSHSIASTGGFSVNGTPSFFIHCLAGNLGAALLELGWRDDARLQSALDWQARLITGEGVADFQNKAVTERYYHITPGPMFVCTANGGLPCAWGAVKAMLALSRVPVALRTPAMNRAVEQGVAFLLSHDPAVADYPTISGKPPSSVWFKFGYPVAYVTDMLQNLEALSALGLAQDPRLTHALDIVISLQGNQGRWLLKHNYNGKMWTDIEKQGQPSKWVTLRALRVLKAAYPE